MTDAGRRSTSRERAGSSSTATGRSGPEASGDASSGGEPTGRDGGDAGDEGDDWTPRFLVTLRDHRYQPAVLVVAALVGLAVAWTHWLGLFAAGALVGLVSRTLPRAALAGLLVGVLVLLGHVLASPAMDPGEFLALTPPAYVTVAAALVAPPWGALVRGVV